jgi:hypothetical protein
MDDVKESIEKASDGYVVDFVEVSVKWATYCLHNLKDDLLAAGLDIARTLAQFDVTMKNP